MVFSPKTNKFVERAVIDLYIPSTKCHIPIRYYITFANNQARKVNGVWITNIFKAKFPLMYEKPNFVYLKKG